MTLLSFLCSVTYVLSQTVINLWFGIVHALLVENITGEV